MHNHQRRKILGLLAAIAASSIVPEAQANAALAFADNPFTLGIASGSPSPDGFVLWTRLMGPELRDHKSIEVRWEVFAADQPGKILAQGRVAATSALAHSVHVEVSGLAPDRWYGYRFIAGDAVSPIGRSRTTPLPDATPNSLRFAYASCQRWEDGHYAAYRHMLAESLDLVVFVGDYIYEYASRKGADAVRTHALPAIRSLDDYRARYALYKSDAHLQRMHAACPWLVTWDDHDVENNYAGSVSVISSARFADKRIAAYQAFYEHMPLRASTMVNGLAGLQQAGALRIYERTRFGRLAAFHVLDDRQYRSAPLCGPKPDEKLAAVCRPVDTDTSTMLGAEQETWLDQSLAHEARHGTRWNLIVQQTAFAPRNYRYGQGNRSSTDNWDGYPVARKRLLDSIVNRRPRNPVFIGGDIHQNWVAQVHRDPYSAATPIIASEFCGTSISSRGVSKERAAMAAAANPHCLLANSELRGYGVVELRSGSATVRLRVVQDVASAESPISTLASFVVQDGAPKIVRS